MTTGEAWGLPAAFFVAVVGLFGALIGSFLNVVIHRVPRDESIAFPASHCPSCGTAIRPYDNIPVVSWAVLRGRCRSCRAPISARYPAVELLTAVLFAL
ncbi:MAG TPA: prepilin peptidase, partial [Pyrinomonadaceae bacterium]|nr:prepilin peptidase [Pyrinomonadaceae bacterium]